MLLERMIHIAAGISTVESLMACVDRLVASIAIPEGSSIRSSIDSSISEVGWLRMQFTDGSELKLWPESFETPIAGRPYPLESFVAFAEFRNEALLVPSGDLYRTQQRFFEVPTLTGSFANQQIRSIRICSALDCLEEGTTLRVDSLIQMMIDKHIIEFITDDSQVLPMALGIRHIARSSENAF